MSGPVATLSMYDWPETADALDRFWSSIYRKLSEAGISAPERLSRIEQPSLLWTDPNLLIGQTCGWPYANTLRGTVVPFTRFDYGIDGCPAGYYNSVFIGQDFDDQRFLQNLDALLEMEKIAINGNDSQSGFHVFREITGEYSSKAIPENKRLITGAHRNSVKAVADGVAQIAAIDAVAFELAKQFEPEAVSKVTVLGHSKPKPGLPLITSLENSEIVSKLYSVIEDAILALAKDDRELLMIEGLTTAMDADYEEFL